MALLNRPTLFFVHGWGCDARIWQPLRERLADWPHSVAEAGYFGASCAPPPDGPVIAIGHSLGGMRLLADPPPQCLGLALINSFPRFSAAPGWEAGTPVRLIDRMLARLTRQPQAVLADFLARAGGPACPLLPDWDAAALDTQRLLTDLLRLRDDDQRHALQGWRRPLAALAATDDAIVAPALTQAALPGAAQWLPTGGHLLPWAAADACADFLRGFLAQWDR
ncbi:alpha/beta fold hydrolase [Bordetella trematum]|uniref:alpha/beta fold hydrolase n=1 Tax=Bordetella trematum TaxID=123899 RepID=UPI003AF3A797